MLNNMIKAIEEAKIVLNNEKDVPIGCVIIFNNQIISATHNLREMKDDITAHAEILAIREAQKKLKTSRLNDCEMYITLEPCPMCAGAILNSRIKKIYIGCESNIKSNKEIIKNILQNTESDHFVEIEYLNNLECSEILTNFFSNKR